MIFVFQAVVAIISVAGVMRMPETNKVQRHILFTKMAGPYVSLSRNLVF